MAIGVGPVTVGAGHVVVTHALPEVGPDGTQAVGIGTLGWLFVPQLVVVQLFSAVGLIDAQDDTPVGPVVAVEHVRVTQLLPDAAVWGVHADTGVLV